jgi:CelD/BcsL family acetyltransferase involved in cellulose biosynthesis
MDLTDELDIGGERFRLSLGPARGDSRLPAEWTQLAAVAGGSVFLSWPWMEAFLAGLPESGFEPYILRLRRGERLGGLALLVARPAGRPGAGWTLNESGDAVIDAATLEYNGFLLDPALAASGPAALLSWLTGRGLAARSIRLGGLDPRMAQAAREAAAGRGWLVRSRQSQETFRLTLEAFRGDPDRLTGAFSRNTRAALQRAERLYEAEAPLVWETAGSQGDALSLFDELERVHTAQWRARGQGGAFAQPGFRRFHERLIETGFASGLIRLHRLRHKDRTLGLLYNLAWQGKIYAYQSGFVFDEDKRRKPGYLAHGFAIRDAIAAGAAAYDFCAGVTQLKTSLSNHREPMVWLELLPPTPLNRLIAWARNAKKAWRTGRPG